MGETAPALEATIADTDIFYTWYKDGAQVQAKTKGAYTFDIDTNNATFSGDYTVKVEGNAICTETTPALTISKTGEFTVSNTNPLDMVILPGQTKNLAVTTTAASPTYQWYRNTAAITGATTSTLTINQDGEYYVQLTQGGACAATINSEKTVVVSPVSFELIADYTTAYSDCQNTSIVLDIKTVNAVASDGTKTDVTTDLKSSFSYQWKKDGVAISGANSSSISLTAILENGTYQVDGVIDSFNSSSNSLAVILRGNETIEIEASSITACNSSDQITISTARDLTGETFQWLKDGSVINTTDQEINTTETGKYQLVISQIGCPLPSNELTIVPFDESLITLDSPNDVVFPEGSSKTITASGGTAYEWVDSTNNIISTSESVNLTTEGSYTLTAYIDACVVLKQINVTYKDTFKIPNVITVNGDGINDLWLIPNTYSKKDEITVIIYNDKGVEVLNVNDYQNNWPESSSVFPSQNMVFYYKIKKGGDILKQGTITVIK